MAMAETIAGARQVSFTMRVRYESIQPDGRSFEFAEVRRVLIDRFDEEAIEDGEAMWRLGERFVPVYLHHRFQLGAVVKTIGGMEFRYGVRGDPVPVTEMIAGDRQREP